MGEVYVDRLGRTKWRDYVPDCENTEDGEQRLAIRSIHDFCMVEGGDEDFDLHPEMGDAKSKPSKGKILLREAIVKLNSYMAATINLVYEFRMVDNYWFMKSAEESAFVRDYASLHAQIVRAAQAIRECQQRGETEIDPKLCRIEI